MNKIKIVIADDYKIYRDGLKVCLSADENMEIIAEADNGAELMKILESVSPDVILMDIKMPVMNGMEATRLVHNKYPDIKILVVTMYEDEEFIIHLMENGANGYLLKNAGPDELVRSIYAVFENGYYFNDMINKELLKKIVLLNNLEPIFNRDIELTESEKEALKLICEEKTTGEFAKENKLNPGSEENIRQQLMEKTGVRNTAGLVMYAVKNGLVNM